MPTDRLYYHDSYARAFRARVTGSAADGQRVYLDRTAFYPASGGQPSDTGVLDGVPVHEVVDEDDDRVAHLLAAPLSPDALRGEREVQGSIDWARRWDHMQQHTGQHLLSAALHELFGMPTLSFHLGAEASTIDLGAAALSPQQVAQAEARCAAIVAAARRVAVRFEEAAEADGLRKASERRGTLRIVAIEGIDKSACGGTHVRSTSEIGLIQIRKLDKIRGNVRLEFVCGDRALRRVREDEAQLPENTQISYQIPVAPSAPAFAEMSAPRYCMAEGNTSMSSSVIITLRPRFAKAAIVASNCSSEGHAIP